MFSIAGTADAATPAQPVVGEEAIAAGSTSPIAENHVAPAKVVTLSSPLMTLLAAQYANAAEHMLLGKLQGRTQPSARELAAWCKKHLHTSFLHMTFLHMTFLGQSYFEVSFSAPGGKIDTLRRSGFSLGDLEIVFSPWQPSFEPEDPACVDSFSYAIWAQFCGLNSLLRTKECLTEIGKHIGTVLAVEEDDANRASVAGLRVRISVPTKDLKTLPHGVEIPQIGSFSGKTCKVVYSGLPELCRDCDTYAHSPKNCPVHEEPDFHVKSFYAKEKGKGLKPLRLQRQTSGRPDERVVFQQALSFVENPSLRDEEIMPWSSGKPGFGNKALSASLNSQYAMTLSGPLSAPHSPSHSGSQEVVSRWTGSCAGITPLSTKFSSRPAHAM